MADEEQLSVLLQGSNVWNAWREEHPDVRVDLTGANLGGANLIEANLCQATLAEADLWGANLHRANLQGAYLQGANLERAYLADAVLCNANLTDANLTGADLQRVKLVNANLVDAGLEGANLSNADLHHASLERAYLVQAILVDTDLTGADVTDCRVYGISAWNPKLEGATQKNLIITSHYEPDITVDDLEVAQFIYLLLDNEKLRHVIDTITSKVVLILGRFTEERKAVLDTLREELRQRDYVPVLFDFEKPASKDRTGTVQTLANMARFVIADLTDPTCVPHELAMVVPNTQVPVQPVLLEGEREYAMFVDLRKRHHWVLEPYRYTSRDRLIADLSEYVIVPAEAKARELRGMSTPTR